MVVLAIMGKAGSGKDTAAYYLSKLLPNKVQRYAFANKLKQVASMMGWDGKKDTKGRKLLQDLGTIGREYIKDIWVDYVIVQILLDSPKIAVITDVRYPNEIYRLENFFNKVYTIRVIGRQYDLGLNGQHSSENSLNDFLEDITLDNSGTKEELQERIKSLITTYHWGL